MGHALFYHLTRSSPEQLVGQLAGRALGLGWRVVLRARERAELERLDAALWLHPEDGFLPHGLAGGPHDAEQPLLLTIGAALPNGARAILSLQGAEVTPEEIAAHERVWIVFDGHDEAALSHARGQWRELTAAGAAAEYWSEASGRWQMQHKKEAATS